MDRVAVDNMAREERKMGQRKDRERDVQVQEENMRIKEAKYNKRYKDMTEEDNRFQDK